MPVYINNFEVINEQPTPVQSADQDTPDTTDHQQQQQDALKRMLRHLWQRQARLHAD